MQRRFFLAAAPALALAPFAARAQSEASTALSALSMLPVAVSVAAPVALLSAGVVLTVVAVEASAVGVAWVLESAVDGSRAVVRFGASAAGGVSLAVGTVVTVTAIGAGCILSAAGRAIAFIPNEIGKALLYDERISR